MFCLLKGFITWHERTTTSYWHGHTIIIHKLILLIHPYYNPGTFEVKTPLFGIILFKLLFGMRENLLVYSSKYITMVVNKVAKIVCRR